MNKVLRSLVFSDLFILSSFGLIQPIFAVFILKNIADVTITAVGIAVTISLFTKATLEVLVARWADEGNGNCRDLYTLLAGSLIISCVPLLYAVTHTLGMLYFAQFLYGVGQALSYPSWRVIFTRYTTHDRTGFEWGVYDTVTSFGVAAAATLGAYIAEKFSFQYLFIFVSIMSFAGTGFITHIFQQEFSCRINFKKTGHKG